MQKNPGILPYIGLIRKWIFGFITHLLLLLSTELNYNLANYRVDTLVKYRAIQTNLNSLSEMFIRWKKCTFKPGLEISSR